jgi:hypothetical protein
MRQDYKKLFSHLKVEEPPAHLFINILKQVEKNQRTYARNRFIFNTVALMVSVVALIPAVYFLISEMTQSGFYRYLMLIFSDSGIVANYWQNFGFLLLESLPVLSLTMVLAAFFGLFYFFRRILANSKFYLIKI